ncbi:hypothetical protein [Desulfomarina sp.]
MQTIIMVASLEGVAAFAVIVETGRTGNKKRCPGFVLVIQALNKFTPLLPNLFPAEQIQYSKK